MDEWWATIALMSHERRPGPGAVAAVTDSGGQRALLADLAEDIGVPWTEVEPATEARLRAVLDPSLPAVNPVDAWAGEPHWAQVFAESLAAVVADPGSAIGVAFTEFGCGEHDDIPEGLARVCIDVAAETDKPVIAATFTARQFYPGATLDLANAGIPVLDGAEAALRAIRHAFDHRDFCAREASEAPAAAAATQVQWWRRRLVESPAVDEATGLELLSTFDIPVTPSRVTESAEEAARAAREVGLPVALKTGLVVAHKTDVDGVRLALADEAAVRAAYEDLAARLGSRVLVCAMAPAGVELALGVIRDPDFGPLVMVGAGGVLVELLADVQFALAPVSKREARELLERLRIYPLLLGLRGRPAADLDALCAVMSRLSALAVALEDVVEEIDINPLIATPQGCVAVDALVRVRTGFASGDSAEEFA